MAGLFLAFMVGCTPTPNAPLPVRDDPLTVVDLAPDTPPSPTLFDAVAAGDVALLDELHANGEAIDVLDDEGYSLLQRAVLNADSGMVAQLLGLGLDPNGAPSRKDPPLNLAIDLVAPTDGSDVHSDAGLDIITLLIKAGANPTVHLNGYNSAVQHAMDRRCETCVTLIRELAFATGVE